MKNLWTEASPKDLADVFRVRDHHDEIVTMEGFGRAFLQKPSRRSGKSQKSHSSGLPVFSFGIPNFGRANAGLVAKYCRNDWEKIRSLEEDELVTIEGIGDVMAKAYCDYFRDEKNTAVVDDLLSEVELDVSFSKNPRQTRRNQPLSSQEASKIIPTETL